MMRNLKVGSREPVEACLACAACAAWVASNSVERLGLPREPRGTRKACLYGDVCIALIILMYCLHDCTVYGTMGTDRTCFMTIIGR